MNKNILDSQLHQKAWRLQIFQTYFPKRMNQPQEGCWSEFWRQQRSQLLFIGFADSGLIREPLFSALHLLFPRASTLYIRSWGSANIRSWGSANLCARASRAEEPPFGWGPPPQAHTPKIKMHFELKYTSMYDMPTRRKPQPQRRRFLHERVEKGVKTTLSPTTTFSKERAKGKQLAHTKARIHRKTPQPKAGSKKRRLVL